MKFCCITQPKLSEKYHRLCWSICRKTFRPHTCDTESTDVWPSCYMSNHCLWPQIHQLKNSASPSSLLCVADDASRWQNHKSSFGYKSLFQLCHHSEKESAKTPPPTANKKRSGANACFCSRHLPTLRSLKICTLCCCHSSGGQGYWCRRTDPRDEPDTPRVFSGGGFSLQNVGKLS